MGQARQWYCVTGRTVAQNVFNSSPTGSGRRLASIGIASRTVQAFAGTASELASVTTWGPSIPPTDFRLIHEQQDREYAPTAAADVLDLTCAASSCQLGVVSATPSPPLRPRRTSGWCLDSLATNGREKCGPVRRVARHPEDVRWCRHRITGRDQVRPAALANARAMRSTTVE